MKAKRKWGFRVTIFLLMVVLGVSNYRVAYGQSGNVTTPDSNSNRAYYEWMNKSTADVPRLQKIYVYANAGETIYFGSSTKTNLKVADVKDSLKTSFGYAVGKCDSACMAVTLPYDYNMIESKDVKYSSAEVVNDFSGIEASGYNDTNIYLIQRVPGETEGIINDYKQESAGPSQIGAEDGYDAYSFEAPVDGVYTFRFFGGVITATNPAPVKVNSAFGNSGATVAAFDVTVADDEGTEIKGREFTDVLIQNIGANNVSVSETLYVLTSDGFEYKVGFNKFDPWGFVFFANKRGLLVSNSEDGQDDGVHYRSLLRSVYSKNNDLSDVKNMGVFINAVPRNPVDDESYYIFFDRAQRDVIRWYTGQDALTSSIKASGSNITNFAYKGFNSGDMNTSIEGLGGYFSFDYTPLGDNNADGVNPTSFEIVLDFTNCTTLNEKYKYPANTKNEVVLSNALEVGENRIYWDGNDAFGNVVPKNDADYEVVSMYAKAGEVHFPLIDVEGNPGGMVVQMLNENIEAKKDDGFDVFYNNSKSAVYTYGNTIADNKDYSIDAVDSSSGVMKYTSTKGNQTILDLWTNYRMQDTLWSGSIKITNLDDTCIEADTKWQYYYSENGTEKHYDSSGQLPMASKVELQYRVIDYTIGENKIVDTENHNWQKNDSDVWKKYEGDVLTKIYVRDGENYRVAEKSIKLSASAENAYNPEADDGGGQYGYITIPNYQFENNEGTNNDIYAYDTGGGKCLLFGLPTQVVEDGKAVDKYYQYRVVDKRVNHPDEDKVLQSYQHTQGFGNDKQYELQLPDKSILKKTFYQKESLYYEYKPEMFELPIIQEWNDSAMGASWIKTHRPKAVRVAIMYGVSSGDSEEDITWRKIQQTKYMTLFDNGNCYDDKGQKYNLEKFELPNTPYSGYYPVWKYTSDGFPYYYKIIPVGYSMDGKEFVATDGTDLVLPEYYALESSEQVQYDVVHDTNEYGTLYSQWAKITDVPAMAEIDFVKTNLSNQRIIGSSAEYRIRDAEGLVMYFSKQAGNKYKYVGKVSIDELDSVGSYSTLVATSDTNSQFTITNLPLEAIWMEEMEAPEGYCVDDYPVIIHYADYEDTGTKKNGYEIYELTLSHADRENVVLPATGGEGTTKYIEYGLLFIGMALLGGIYRTIREKGKGEV